MDNEEEEQEMEEKQYFPYGEGDICEPEDRWQSYFYYNN